ncbi:MAG: glycosyltransferase [Acidimicrobiales bacterium]
MPVSVVIPAHNEEAVVGRCLSSLLGQAPPGELEVTVVCNGCQDRTAEVARAAGPAVRVLELPVASKVAALNAGDRAAGYFPRFYVDADVELAYPALHLVAGSIAEQGLLCAAPRPVFALAGRPWPVRAFYRVWQGIPYLNQDMVGSGVYALSGEGRSRFGEFPELTADDQYVQQLFERGERRAVEGAEFVVHSPRHLRGLLAMRVRSYRGNRELARLGLARLNAPPSGFGAALRQARSPARLPAVAVYIAVNFLAKVLARRPRRLGAARWERDESARHGPPARTVAEEGPICYVTSHYPRLSHTFVQREVEGLRAAGAEVATVSVHRAGAADVLSEADRREAEQTWSMFPLDAGHLLTAHLRAGLRHPGAYARTLASALGASPGGVRGGLWQLFYFAEAIALWAHAREAGARHLHAHLANVAADICWWAARFGSLAAPVDRWRWSFTMHGPTEFFEVRRFNLARKVAHADLVVCISEFTRSQLMYLSDPAEWAKLRVVHCGADLSRYHYVAPRAGPGLHVLCVARWASQKGLEVLLDAVEVAAGSGTDVELTLVGDGPLRDRLHQAAQRPALDGRVRLEGAVGQDDLAKYYADADVFCLASLAEGVPVALMEAMATGRPVVATRVGGIAELVEDGVSGYLVAPGEVAELAGALARLAASPKLRRQMGAAGRQKVERDFDSARCAAALAGIYRGMGRESGPTGKEAR